MVPGWQGTTVGFKDDGGPEWKTSKAWLRVKLYYTMENNLVAIMDIACLPWQRMIGSWNL